MTLSEKAESRRRWRPRTEFGVMPGKSLALIWPSALRFSRYDGMSGTTTFVIEDPCECEGPAPVDGARRRTHCLGVTTEPVN